MRENIKDSNGRVIAMTEDVGNGKTNVYDPIGRLLGYSDQRGTYDSNGRMILSTPAPSYLIGRVYK